MLTAAYLGAGPVGGSASGNIGRDAEIRRVERVLAGMAADRVHQLHHRGDRRVEDATATDIVLHLGERLVRDAAQVLVGGRGDVVLAPGVRREGHGDDRQRFKHHLHCAW